MVNGAEAFRKSEAGLGENRDSKFENRKANVAVGDIRNGTHRQVGLPSPKGRGWPATALSPVRRLTEPSEGSLPFDHGIFAQNDMLFELPISPSPISVFEFPVSIFDPQPPRADQRHPGCDEQHAGPARPPKKTRLSSAARVLPATKISHLKFKIPDSGSDSENDCRK
jgi:hypothetical protein